MRDEIDIDMALEAVMIELEYVDEEMLQKICDLIWPDQYTIVDVD